jgi:hypothetical protein
MPADGRASYLRGDGRGASRGRGIYDRAADDHAADGHDSCGPNGNGLGQNRRRKRQLRAVAQPEAIAEPPRPLMRELPPADPFPVDALGSLLHPAALAIHDRRAAPKAICGQSVLAAATLAVQGHANVELPTGDLKPLSAYFVSVAATGERKSAVDQDALGPIRKREAALREVWVSECAQYDNDKDAWNVLHKLAIKMAATGDPLLLAALGQQPLPPLEPILTCPDPTYEGLCKLLENGQPSIGIFTSEGGQFIGGHGMTDAKVRTSSGLSALWDGGPIKRIRAGHDPIVLPDRRVTMHLMAQPEVAAIWLGDSLLAGQGLMSRMLLTAPDAASGTRMWREPSTASNAALEVYGARLLEILQRPLPLVEGTRNELAPRTIALSPDARKQWITFHDYVEERLGAAGDFETVRGLGNKLPEHAARIAAVLALVGDIEASEVAPADMGAGIAVARHYAAEAKRLFGAGRIPTDLRDAQRLLTWLHTSWSESLISLPDIYQRGPNSIRHKKCAERAVKVLEEHGWLVPIPGRAVVAGTTRQQAWRVVRG